MRSVTSLGMLVIVVSAFALLPAQEPARGLHAWEYYTTSLRSVVRYDGGRPVEVSTWELNELGAGLAALRSLG